LASAVQAIQETTLDAEAAAKRDDSAKPSVIQHPEAVDDFVRNFLVRMNMFRTLDCFETEWYELREKGQIPVDQVGVVSDVYSKSENMALEVQRLHDEAEKFKIAAMKAKDTYVRLRKERDYHRMHHKRVVQEKNRLITDLRRMRDHYACYEPTLRTLKHKYETAMKEKMLTKLERDRIVNEVQGLKSVLKTIEQTRASSGTNGSATVLPGVIPCQRNGSIVMLDKYGRGPTQQALAAERAKWEAPDVRKMTEPRYPNDSKFPKDTGINPLLAHVKPLQSGKSYRLTQTIQAHTLAVSSLALHPRKQVLATASDDQTWKVWGLPNGELIMTGRGHTDWVAGCDFHPSGVKLATVSGDTTVKIWDFAKGDCVHTFTDHQKAVWSCSWHSCGDFLATCSMDKTGKLWDLNSLRCRYTLRGHTESVNSIEFLPFSNTLLTCSADKTVSLWDARTSICAQTFYGHHHSVNHCTFNMRGDTIASCDSYGAVKMWDVRNVASMTTIDCGPHPANMVSFDPSGSTLAVASNDASIKIYEVASGKLLTLAGHEDAVQCVLFERAGEFLVSGGSDLTFRIWA
jgi:WD40 repeat protein